MAPTLLERTSLECFEWLPSELHYSRHVQFLMGLLAGRPTAPRPSIGPALASHMCMSSYCHRAPESGYYQPLSDEESEVQKGLAACPRATARQGAWPGLSPGLWTADPIAGQVPPGHMETGAQPSTQAPGTKQPCGPQGDDPLTAPPPLVLGPLVRTFSGMFPFWEQPQ